MAISAGTAWRVRPSGNNLNGAGFNSSNTSPGTDRSQQNVAQVTFDGATIRATTSGVTDTITLVGTTGSAADNGNVVHIIGGTNFIAGWYEILVGTSSTWQLDRNCTTGAGAAMTGRMGGGWVDFTNFALASAIMVAGNTAYILGGASPSSGSPDYAPVAAVIPVAGTAAAGVVRIIGDPNTPGSNGFGGRPYIKAPGQTFASRDLQVYQNLYFVGDNSTNGCVVTAGNTDQVTFINCVLDQNGWDIGLFDAASGTGSQSGTSPALFLGCEVFSSAAKRTTNVLPAMSNEHYGLRAYFCNIHDCIGDGIWCYDAYCDVVFTIIANNGGIGVKFSYANLQSDSRQNGIWNCTIDANAGDGISFDHYGSLLLASVHNCIISNHVGGGKYGFKVADNTATLNAQSTSFTDYNTFYGNTTDRLNVNAGPNSVVAGSSPYVAQSTQNYALV